jgi:two-component system cell cycle response regulator
MKVLIIDDSPHSLVLARARLAQEQLDIVEANSGKRGIEAATLEQPDLILLDLDMPDMPGFDVCRQLKSCPETCMIPVIFLTGTDSTEARVKGLDLGAVDYIAKPFDGFELRARVRAALRTKRMQDLLIKYAHIDPLTELWNRRALMQRLEQEWAQTRRHGGQMAFVMADADHFKHLNDLYGHHVGDQMLRAIAGAIMRQCREIDLPVRYGGEEFAILLPGEKAEDAANLAERCRQEVAATRLRTEGGSEAQATASFGVADSIGLSSYTDVIRKADEALYRAKAAGRNCVVVADAAQPTLTQAPAAAGE